MKSSKELNLTEGSIIKGLTLFIIPILIGSLIQQLYVTIDAVIVGQFVGKNGLAAIDSVATLFKFPLNFMCGLSSGITILVSNYIGAKDKKGVNYTIKTALIIAVFLGVICSVIGVIFTSDLLKIMCVPEEIFEETYLYTVVYFAGIWAMILFNVFSGILRAMGDSKRPLYILIVCAIVNIIGDLLCVNILGLGVMGASIATAFAQVVSAILTFILVARTQKENGKISFLHLPFQGKYYIKILKTGIPIAIQLTMYPIANSIIQASVNNMGTNEIAAWGVGGKLDLLIWLISDAINAALITYVSQNIGAKKIDRVNKGTLIGIIMSSASVAFISLILFFFTGIMGTWFIAAKDVDVVIPLAVHYIQMKAPFFFLYAIGEGLAGACCSMGNTVVPMILTLTSICLLRVIGIFFVLPSFNSMECITWIYIASWFAVALVFIICFIVRSKKVKNNLA